MNRLTTLAALTAAATLAAGQASAVEIANANAGFELGDTSGWADFTGAATFEAVNDGTAFEGTYYGRITNTTAPLGAVIKQANLAAGSVAPGSEVTISFVARGSAAVGGVHFAELFSELSGGGTSSAEILGGGPLFPPSDTDWTPYSFTTTLGPDVSGGVTLQFVATTGAASGSESILEIDAVSVDVVPEPTSLALLGLGGLAMMRRRRA